jgi:hypothetical protein
VTLVGSAGSLLKSLAFLSMSWSARLLLVVTLVVGCREPTRGCDVCTFSALVYGTVTSSNAFPAAGAIVRVYTGLDECSESASATAVADGLGHYRMQVQSGFQTPACVEVDVWPQSGGAPAERIAVPSVQFKRTSEASLPYDSVRVDVRLP